MPLTNTDDDIPLCRSCKFGMEDPFAHLWCLRSKRRALAERQSGECGDMATLWEEKDKPR